MNSYGATTHEAYETGREPPSDRRIERVSEPFKSLDVPMEITAGVPAARELGVSGTQDPYEHGKVILAGHRGYVPRKGNRSDLP
jgi:hypothetical protein